MRCCSCNKILSDSEASRRFVSTKEFIDMCRKCYEPIEDDVPTYIREDLDDEPDHDEYSEELEDEEGDSWDDGADAFIKRHFKEQSDE